MRFMCIVVLLSVAVSDASAQQVTVSTPFQSNSDSFFERNGTNWGFNWGNAFFSFGGPNMAIPQFGGFDPSAGISSGIYYQRGNFNGYFNWAAGHGFRQSFVTQVPSVTMMNGQSAQILDQSASPFVMGFIPVVGGYPTTGYMMGGGGVSPLVGNPEVRALIENMQTRRQRHSNDLPEPPAVAPGREAQPRPKAAQRAGPNAAQRAGQDDLDLVAEAPGAASPNRVDSMQSSSAGRAVPSVAEARRLHEAEQASGNDEAMVLLERGRAAEARGKHGAAKVYYQMVARRASGQLREQAEARLHSLSSPGMP
ncbi:MAG: hypothetical protein V3R99_12015 [Thermoguttaceae bacterium]